MQTRLWSRRFRTFGWLCVAGSVVLVANFLAVLPELSDWWQEPAQSLDGGLSFRWMHMDLFVGWFGWWGYLATFLWLPAALWKIHRRTDHLALSDRILLSLNLALPVFMSSLVRLTPLKYASFNVFVL